MHDRFSEVLDNLKAGNQRFVSGDFDLSRYSRERRLTTFAEGQEPHALVVGCSDSRVPLEMVLGQGVGDLFVVRTAGNLCGTFGIASLEFAVEVLHVPVLVVLGHTECGAIKAALNPPDFKADRIDELIYRIEPSVTETKRRFPDLPEEAFLREAVKANARDSLNMIIRYSSLIRERIDAGKLCASFAVLDIETGEIEWCGDQSPSKATVSL